MESKPDKCPESGSGKVARKREMDKAPNSQDLLYMRPITEKGWGAAQVSSASTESYG